MSSIIINHPAGQGYQCTTTIREHGVIFDVGVDKGGDDLGPSPHEMLLASLGACTAITLRMYAVRKEWPLEDVTVSLSHEETPRGQTVYKKITLTGALSDEQRDRLYSIAEKCPVNQVVANVTDILAEHD